MGNENEKEYLIKISIESNSVDDPREPVIDEEVIMPGGSLAYDIDTILGDLIEKFESQI